MVSEVVTWHPHAHPERDPCHCFHTGVLIDHYGHRRFLLASPLGPEGREMDWHLWDRQTNRSMAKFPGTMTEDHAKAAAGTIVAGVHAHR